MKTKSFIQLLLACAFLLPVLAMAETPVKAKFVMDRTTVESNLQDVQLVMPGLYNPMTGQRTTREDFEQSIAVRKIYDASSPYLALAAMQAKSFDEINLELDIASNDPGQPGAMLHYKLENVLITSYSTHTNADGVPVETISLNFEKIAWTYDKMGKD